MSTRALRRLRGKQRGQEALDLGDLTLGDSSEEQAASEEDQVDTANVSHPSNRKGSGQKGKKNKAQKNFSNLFELIGDVDEAEKISPDEESVKPNENKSSGGEKKDKKDIEKPNQTHEEASTQPLSGDRVKKKKKNKKKKTKVMSENGEDAVPDDNIDLLLENLEKSSSQRLQSEELGGSERSCLHVEHRNLNPETELKKYFGARAVQGDQRPRQRNRHFHRSTWMTSLKDSWPRYSRPAMKRAFQPQTH